jgi:hypothetical protein
LRRGSTGFAFCLVRRAKVNGYIETTGRGIDR